MKDFSICPSPLKKVWWLTLVQLRLVSAMDECLKVENNKSWNLKFRRSRVQVIAGFMQEATLTILNNRTKKVKSISLSINTVPSNLKVVSTVPIISHEYSWSVELLVADVWSVVFMEEPAGFFFLVTFSNIFVVEYLLPYKGLQKESPGRKFNASLRPDCRIVWWYQQNEEWKRKVYIRHANLSSLSQNMRRFTIIHTSKQGD